MAASMKVLYVLWAILAGLFIGLLALITFPLLLLYAGVKIIGGMASIPSDCPVPHVRHGQGFRPVDGN